MNKEQKSIYPVDGTRFCGFPCPKCEEFVNTKNQEQVICTCGAKFWRDFLGQWDIDETGLIS